MSVTRNIERYAASYQADYGFESVMVAYRRRLLIERLNTVNPATVLEIGCGSELLYSDWLSTGIQPECWVIVEPAEEFAALARASNLPNLRVIRDVIENAVDDVLRVLPRRPDLVVCSSLLHEVPSPEGLLAAVRAVMAQYTQLHVNVPNSESLHRRLAQAMGLVTETKALSERNRKLMQHRVYDMTTLMAELASAGLRVVDSGGYLTKPFTHSQMETLLSEVDGGVIDGLYELGKQMPESASEIWAEARLQQPFD